MTRLQGNPMLGEVVLVFWANRASGYPKNIGLHAQCHAAIVWSAWHSISVNLICCIFDRKKAEYRLHYQGEAQQATGWWRHHATAGGEIPRGCLGVPDVCCGERSEKAAPTRASAQALQVRWCPAEVGMWCRGCTLLCWEVRIFSAISACYLKLNELYCNCMNCIQRHLH